MQTAIGIIVKRNDGLYVNLFWEATDVISRAARFYRMEDYTTFMTGHYAPKNPEIYSPQFIEVTYKECDPPNV